MMKKLYFFLTNNEIIRNLLIFIYRLGGRKPWSSGYIEYKWKNIEKVLNDKKMIRLFGLRKIPDWFGVGIDERIVEYPWVFSNLSKLQGFKILDAGSVFNYPQILNQKILQNQTITIYTFAPEMNNIRRKNVSYIYGDLRDLPFKNEYFDEIVCQSTLEHIDMDNSMYGYDMKNFGSMHKSYQYLSVVSELCRVLRNKGLLLLTFPFGKYENHGFFQQFDSEMVDRIKLLLSPVGRLELFYFKYTIHGWTVAEQGECSDSLSFNPHTGKGRNNDGAAHSRAVCCIKFVKK